MQSCTSVVLLVICFSAMTSHATQFGNYVIMTNSTTGAQVCSTDTPTQVLPLSPEGDVRCGVVCMISSCPYYQFKSSAPIQCELYSRFPWNFKKIANCIGYTIPYSYPTDCSFPFTLSGKLYNGCAPNGANGACLTVNRTTTLPCSINTVQAGVINSVVAISNQSVPVQSIFGWIIWMRRDGPVTFSWNVTWASYKNGFGSVGGSNYWLGLERVHMLTSTSNCRLRIEMFDYKGIWYSVEYWSFKVGDEASNKYRLNVDGFSGDASNALQDALSCMYNEANGMKFSTIDADNDGVSGYDCANRYGGGWWFNGCYQVCLTCGYTLGYMYWRNDDCSTAIWPDEVRMLIKPQ